MIKNKKNIISSISVSKQVIIALTSSSLIKLFVNLSEILNTFFKDVYSILSQVALKYSSQILLPSSSQNNRTLPEIKYKKY